MAQDFRIELGVVTNLKPAEKQVQDFIRKKGNKEFTLTPKISTKGINEFRDQFKGIQTDVKLAQAELDKFARYNEKIATSKINNYLRDMSKTLGDVSAPIKETSTTIDKWVNAEGKLITQTTKADSELGKITTRVTEYKNALGQTVIETEKWNASWDKLSHDIQKVDDKIAREAEEMKKLAQAEKEAQQAADSLARSQQNQYNIAKKNAEEVVKSQKQAIQAQEELIQKAKSVDTWTNESSKSFLGLGNSIAEAAGKVMLFKVATSITMAFYNTLTEATDAILEYNKAATEFKKVSDLDGEALNDYAIKLGKLGETVARTRSEMLSSAEQFRKSGYTDEDSARLAQTAELFRNVADAEISSEEAAGFLVSQMKAYGNETQEFANHAANAINNISNNMAVSSADLQSGISKVSSALAAAGNSFEESLALITASSEILHNNANKASRGTRTISANFAKAASTAGELSYSVNGVSRSISLLDENTGDMLNTFQIYQKLYTNGWNEMTNAEKDNLAITYAGKNQMEVFLATMNNFSAAQRALGLAIDDENSAWKENEKYLNSIEAQTNLLKSQFQNMVLGDGGLEQITINVLKLTNGIISLVNTLGGLKTIAIALMGLAIAKRVGTLVEKGIQASKIITSLANTLDTLKTITVIAKENQISLGNAFLSTASKAELAQIAISGVFAVLTAAVAIYSAYKSKQDEFWQSAVEKSEEAKDSFEKSKQALEFSNTVLDDENSDLETVRNALSAVTDEYDKQLDLIGDVNKQREQAIELLEKETKSYDDYMAKQANNTWESNVAGYTSAMKKLSSADATSFLSSGADIPATMGMDLSQQESQEISSAANNVASASGIDNIKKAYEEYIDVLRRVGQAHSDNENTVAKLTLSIGNNKQKLDEIEEKYSEELALVETVNVAMAKYGYVIDQTADGHYKLTASEKEAEEVISEYNKKADVQINTLSELCDQYGLSADSIQGYIDKHPELQDQYEDDLELQVAAAEALKEEIDKRGALAASYAPQIEAMKTIQSEYSNLIAIQNDYNDDGHLTIENLERLNQLSPQYLKALVLEGNQMSINTGFVEEQFEAQKALALVNVDLARQLAVTELCEQTLGGEVSSTNVYLGESQTEASELTTKYNELAQAGLNAARGVQAVRAAKDGKDLADFEANLNKINKIFDDQKKAIKSTELAQTSSDKNKARSSKSSAKDSKDAWLEAYKAEKDALESMYKTGILTDEEYAQKLRELSDKYLTDSADHQKKYAKEIHDAYEAMYTALKKSAKEALEEEEKRLKKIYDSAKDEKTSKLKELKKLHEQEEKAIKSQIDALKKEKDAVKDGYDAKIKALKSEREEYERQVKLMQLKEELAKAKATKQYVMDETGVFTYQENSTAVDEAQENLIEEEAKQKYERELKALETARDNAVAIYEQRIEALEAHYNAVKEQNDKAEEDLEVHYDKMLEQYEKNYEDFKEYADKVLEGQIQATDQENTEWGRRLNNLVNFVNEYNRILAQLGNEGATVSTSYKGQSKGGNSGKNSKSNTSPKTRAYDAKNGVAGYVPYKKRATGDSSIASNGTYLVGDSPNQELVIGSKLNGVPLSLSRGDGVVNAKSTRTFAGLLNMLGGLTKPMTPNATNGSTNNSITISNVSLPNVHNGEEFIDCLQHFDIDMLQKGYDSF